MPWLKHTLPARRVQSLAHHGATCCYSGNMGLSWGLPAVSQLSLNSKSLLIEGSRIECQSKKAVFIRRAIVCLCTPDPDAPNIDMQTETETASLETTLSTSMLAATSKGASTYSKLGKNTTERGVAMTKTSTGI